MEIKIECERVYTLCEGCLSPDRRVTGLSDQNKALFFFLRDDVNSLVDETKHVQLCWECNGVLNKVAEFQSRIRRAQYSLIRYIQSLYQKKAIPPTLSQLKTKDTSHYDHEYIYDETKSETTLDEDQKDLIINKKTIPAEPKNFQIEITEELLSEIKLEDPNIKEEYVDYSDNGNLFDNDIMTDEEVPKLVKKKKVKNYKISLQDYKKFANISENDSVDLSKNHSESIFLSESEIEGFLDKERKTRNFERFPYKCKECVLGYKRPMDLLRHKMLRHKMDQYPTPCLACNTEITTETHLTDHWRQHTKMLRCTLCSEICRSKGEMKKHVNRAHTKIFACTRCQSEFGTLKDFGYHYNMAHERVVCDYCNAVFASKRRLQSHIVRNHIPPYCNICNRSFRQYKFLEKHARHEHPELLSMDIKKELCYCVECDRQYSSVYKYKKHLQDSVKHRPRKKLRIPCPECGKIFSRKSYMDNHVRLIHVKDSKHYCELCDKFFCNGYGVRKHKLYVHQKVPHEKNKICDLCGRGFSTNRILINHRRTHTGERPFKCKYCQATFAQETACKTHQKSQHKNVLLTS